MATKPRKLTTDTFYDIFSSWPAADRAVALRVLEQTHRAISKVEAKQPVEPKAAKAPQPEQGKLEVVEAPHELHRG